MHKRDAYDIYFGFDDGRQIIFCIPQAWRMSFCFVILAAVVLTYTARTNVTRITRFVNICDMFGKATTATHGDAQLLLLLTR